MTTTQTGCLMDTETWSVKIFKGEWITPGAGTYPVIEPASGNQLGVMGQASADDVRHAASHAAEAQKTWARVPAMERARVVRRAGQLCEQYTAEVMSWIIRETGSTP